MVNQKRIKRLEEVGFVWDKFGDAFEKGYKETLKYKQQFGNTNAPATYKTQDGFKLGSWLSVQRKNYNKGTLDKERIKRLEKIGFVWNNRK